MSLGPTNNISRQSPASQARAAEAAVPAAPTAVAAGDVEAQRTAPDADIQAGARLATRGAEESVRARIQADSPAAPATTDAPRRGLGTADSGIKANPNQQLAARDLSPDGGDSRIDHDDTLNAGKRSGKGRHRLNDAETETPTFADTPAIAGKRTASGTRVGNTFDEKKNLELNPTDIGTA